MPSQSRSQRPAQPNTEDVGRGKERKSRSDRHRVQMDLTGVRSRGRVPAQLGEEQRAGCGEEKDGAQE
jgi:hypothetical protein